LTAELNHTIVPVRDKHAAAAFLGRILGIHPGAPVAQFAPLTLANGISLDYMDLADDPMSHYAFLVDEGTFETAFERVSSGGIQYFGEPRGGRPGEQYRSAVGARGFYFRDPDGHLMELLTRDALGREAGR